MKDDYAQARELALDGRFSEAEPHFAAALKGSAGHPAAASLVSMFRFLNKTQIELEDGKWRNVGPKVKGVPEWSIPKSASWTVPEDGVFQVDGANQNTMAQWWRATGEDYEIRATFEFLSPVEHEYLLSVQLGETSLHPHRSATLHIYSDPKKKGKVSITSEFLGAENPEFPVDLEQKNDIIIQCWQGALTLYLNGKPVFQGLQPQGGVPGDRTGCFAFGATKFDKESSLRITNIGLRRLKTKPLPPPRTASLPSMLHPRRSGV